MFPDSELIASLGNELDELIGIGVSNFTQLLKMEDSTLEASEEGISNDMMKRSFYSC